MKRTLSFLFAVAATAAVADCPPALDVSADIDRLAELARAAPNEMTGRDISNQMWELWTIAPDEAAQALLDQGMSARASYDFAGAIDAFDRLVTYCPDYAEGYNQRAFVNFLREDFSAALVDLDRALERRPTHVAALAGKALTLMRLGRDDEAQVVLRTALDLNPWLSERALLRRPSGQDL